MRQNLHYICKLIYNQGAVTMNLPQDPYMKSQYVNMLLKSNNMDLNTLCVSANIDMISLLDELGRAGIAYDSASRQFRT